MRLPAGITTLVLFMGLNSRGYGKTLNLPLLDAPVSLDWNGLSTMIEAPLVLNLNEGLFEYDGPSGKLIPALAESLSKSPDLREYTFKIRKDAKWSDGRNLVADDFANAWLRLLSPQSVSIYIYYLFDIENAKEFNQKEITDPKQVGITVVDDQTLRIRLKRPHSDWERKTAFWPLFPIRKDQIEKYGLNWWRPGVLVSSGPYILDSYEPGKRVVLKRNPHYQKITSDVDEIDFHIGSDQEEIIRKFQSGFFEPLWGITPELLGKLLPKARPSDMPLMRGHLLALNMAKFPMTNLEFRTAILQAISVPDLIPKGFTQLIPTSTFIPKPLPGSEGKSILDFNLKEAKEHLRKSGILINSKLKIRILTNLTEPYYSVGKNIQAQLMKNLGLNVELAALQSRDYTAYINLGDYTATLITWTAKVLSPQDFLLPYSREAIYNRMNYSNPFFEQWIFQGIKAQSGKEAAHDFLEAEKLLGIKDAVASPLFTERAVYLSTSSIKNIYFTHMGIPILKFISH